MRRDAFGNFVVILFALFLFALFVNKERLEQGGIATTPSVLLPAAYQTAFAMGGWICLALIGLHLSRRKPRSR